MTEASKLSLLTPDKVKWQLMPPVTSTDVTKGMTNNLHPEGLYSIEIFGRVGSEQRDETESWIDFKLPVFIPLVFNELISIKGLYQGILKKSEYAVWDPEQKDFIKSNMMDGQTGFSFFMKHYPEIDFRLTESFKRKKKIELLDRFRKGAVTDRILTLPAGLRDIQFNPGGGTTEVEINEYFRKLLFKCRSLNNADPENPMYDDVRWGLQMAINEIDDYVFRILNGKKGFIQAKALARSVTSGTRNVITARITNVENADEIDPHALNSTDMGLFQCLLAYQYVAKYALLNGFLVNIFTPGNNTVRLIDRKTLEAEYVELSPDVIDKWGSSEGLTKLFNGFNNREIRLKPILISGHYLALVYDDGKEVAVIRDINELPPERNKKFLRPITYMELYYIFCAQAIEDRMVQNTRYPITGIGSIYPAFPKVKTLDRAYKRTILDQFWEPRFETSNYPDPSDNGFFDAMSIHPSKEGAAGADHDGDQLTANSINAKDSIAECKNLLDKRIYYISGTGNFYYDPTVETHEYLFRALSLGIKKI